MARKSKTKSKSSNSHPSGKSGGNPKMKKKEVLNDEVKEGGSGGRSIGISLTTLFLFMIFTGICACVVANQFQLPSASILPQANATGTETEEQHEPKPQEPVIENDDVVSVDVDAKGTVTQQTDEGEKEKLDPDSFEVRHTTDGRRIYTKEELAIYDGTDPKKPIWLAMLGEVFDVSKGKQHYGKKGGYGFFSGKDATAAFVTGKFKDGLTEDISELKPSQLLGIEDWVGFYRTDYTPLGILEGHYYDHDGNPTKAIDHYKHQLQFGEQERKEEEALKKKYPSCNSRSGQDIDSEVWCSRRSGGVERSWVGVPRRLHEPGKERQRCVCVEYELAKDNPNMRIYDKCAPKSEKCVLQKASKKNKTKKKKAKKT